MAKHLGDKTGWLKACQKRSEELAAILWIQLRFTGSCRKGQKELFLGINSTSWLNRIILLRCLPRAASINRFP